MWYIIVPLTLIVALFILIFVFTSCHHKNPDLKALSKYRYAHRGLHKKPKVPENSMSAFRLALDKGFGIELDVHLTKDGHLAVIHDYTLSRTAGVDLTVEKLTSDELKKYPLEDSDERIPMLEEVLELFDGKAPIIIEIKADKGNYSKICETLSKTMDNYHGLYCIESFFPQTVMWYRKNRPDVCRGQLSANFFSRGDGEGLSFIEKFLLSNLFVNLLGKPDFVAYRFKSRKFFSFVFTRIFHHPQIFYWTITNKEDMIESEKNGASPIFEQFIPDSPRTQINN